MILKSPYEILSCESEFRSIRFTCCLFKCHFSVEMIYSTLSVFPASKDVLQRTKLPFALYVNAIPGDMLSFSKTECDILRCPNCSAYFSSLCQNTSVKWICAVCGHQSAFKEGIKLPFLLSTTPKYQIVDTLLSVPVIHVIVIGSGDIYPARVIMQSLPPTVPVQIYVMSSHESAQKLEETAEHYEQLEKLPQVSEVVSLHTTITLLVSLISSKKKCFWCRVFCKGGIVDDDVLEKMQQFRTVPMRIDCFVDSPVEPSVIKFNRELPGICRVYQPFTDTDALNEAVDTAARDCVQAFAYQCKTTIKCGPDFAVLPLPKKGVFPVVSSTKTFLHFDMSAPESETKQDYQVVQAVTHAHVWDPPTNMLRKVTNILNAYFPVSLHLQRVIQSAAPSLLFDHFCRQSVPQKALHIPGVDPNFKVLLELYKGMKDKEALSCVVVDTCAPTLWRFLMGKFVETWSDSDSDEVVAVLVNKFPDLYFAVRNGADLLLGDIVVTFVELFKPLHINVKQMSLESIQRFL